MSTPRPLSPEERLVASYRAGQGLYSALQLKNQVFDAPEDPEDDVLKLKLPKSKLEGIAKHSSFDPSESQRGLHGKMVNHFGKALSTPVTIGVGGLAGFHGAAKDYEHHERKHLEGELNKAEKEYLDLLSQVKVSSYQDTPCVDAFCRGMASMAISSPADIEKAAKDDMADGSIKRLLGDTLSPIAAPYHAAKHLAVGATTATALSAALATYMLKQKADRKQDGQAPSRIEIEPV
jgi:hypothetical protein